MNIRVGGHSFVDVTVPLLWGSRAILQDSEMRVSVIDLRGDQATPEIVGDQPAPGIPYQQVVGGFRILLDGPQSYTYFPAERRLSSSTLSLPDCVIETNSIRIGTNTFSGLDVRGVAVGIAVTEDSISVGAPLPEGLAKSLFPRQSGATLDSEAALARALAAETLVMEKLEEAFSATHDRTVAQGYPVGDITRRVDGILWARSLDQPDLLVEIKYFSRRPMTSALAAAVMQGASLPAEYFNALSRRAVSLLFVILDQEDPHRVDQARAQVAQFMSNLKARPAAFVYTRDGLTALPPEDLREAVTTEAL